MAIEGGATTLMLAEAGAPVPPSFDVTFPVTLFSVPAADALTFTENVQPRLAAMLPPLRLTTFVPATAVIVPLPQDPANPLGLSMAKPAGRVSVNATPVNGIVGLGFWMANVSDVEAFSGIDAAPKLLLIAGGPTTVIPAVDVLPGPPWTDVTWTVLTFSPTVVPCTLTDTVQESVGCSVPPDRLMEFAPATAVIVPPQLLLTFGVDATTSPAGRLSVNATVSATKFGFDRLNVRDVVPFSRIVAAPNVFVMLGGEATINVAVLLVTPVPPLVELTAPVVFVTVAD